jgi:hypothetical protein
MKRISLTIALGLVSAFAAVACGSGGSNSLDPNKHIADLTADEQKQLCDETAKAQGGYGRKMTCPDGHTERTDLDQTRCVRGVQLVAQHCPSLTVGDGLSCAQRQGNDLCLFTTIPECKAQLDCVTNLPQN